MKTQVLTMVDPTATLMLSVSSSLTDTLTALRHSIYNVNLGSYKHGTKYKPATELIPGSRIRPTQSLLIVLETASMDSTKRSTVSAIAYSMIDRYHRQVHPTKLKDLRQSQEPREVQSKSSSAVVLSWWEIVTRVRQPPLRNVQVRVSHLRQNSRLNRHWSSHCNGRES